MRSWVRYSVSAYLGLLLAGTISAPLPTAPRYQEPMASIDWIVEPAALPVIRLTPPRPTGHEQASHINS